MLVECCSNILALNPISNISRFQTEDGEKFWNRDINFTSRFEAKRSLFSIDWHNVMCCKTRWCL